jgi:hypothetical protein
MGCEDDRHPIVDRPDQRVGLGREQGRRLDRAAVPLPPLPQARDAERASAGDAEQVRVFLAADHAPFVEGIGRHQAPAQLERRAERRLLLHRLGPCVDELVADGRVVGPRGDQAPAGRDALAAAVGAEADDRQRLRRRDVVAGRLDRRVGDGEGVEQGLLAEPDRQPPAHRRSLRAPAVEGEPLGKEPSAGAPVRLERGGPIRGVRPPRRRRRCAGPAVATRAATTPTSYDFPRPFGGLRLDRSDSLLTPSHPSTGGSGFSGAGGRPACASATSRRS